MTHLLDTDVLSIWQNGTGAEYAVSALRLSAYPPADIGVPVVSFHEQMIGANAYLNRGRTGADWSAGTSGWNDSAAGSPDLTSFNSTARRL